MQPFSRINNNSERQDIVNKLAREQREQFVKIHRTVRPINEAPEEICVNTRQFATLRKISQKKEIIEAIIIMITKYFQIVY